MSEMITVALDAMGGDYAPLEIVKGGIEAIKEQSDIQIILVGDETAIRSELSKYKYDESRVSIIGTTEVIGCDEPPVLAIRHKKDSSLVRCQYLVKEGKADALVSAGSSGAILAGGQLIVGRLKGVQRPPLAPLIPKKDGYSLLIDCGANVDARPQHLLQFAKMGSAYMQYCMGISSPKVAIVNIGAEEEKGNQLVKETYPLLKACNGINFVGSIEARDIPDSDVDVIVCEAFTGNVILKLYEGVAMTLMSMVKERLMSSVRGKIGGLLIKPSLKSLKKNFDSTEYGGAPLLGLKGLVVKAHGNSDAYAIKNAIYQCKRFKDQQINERIKEALAEE